MRSDRAVTLQDIADRLGITRSTASFAITGRGRVSEDTRRRVLAVAEEIGYRPNNAARSLRGARTGALALRVPPNSHALPYYMHVISGITEEADRAGMVVFLLPSKPTDPASRELAADAVIALDPAQDDPVVRALLQGRSPVITAEPTPAGLPSGSAVVMGDHDAALRRLLDHLATQGMRHPGALIPDIGSHWAFTVRQTLIDWCASRGLLPRVHMLPFPASPEMIARAVEDLVSPQGDGVTSDAILAATDGTALSVAATAQGLGRRIGQDLLVAALVDSEPLELTEPSITALDLDPRELGRRCVRAALAALAASPDDPSPAPDVVPVRLIIRSSTSTPLSR